LTGNQIYDILFLSFEINICSEKIALPALPQELFPQVVGGGILINEAL
jgi:hypothetical protein